MEMIVRTAFMSRRVLFYCRKGVEDMPIIQFC